MYLLRNHGDPEWHKFGQTWPNGKGQCVAMRACQINNGANKRPKARWFPDRIAVIRSNVTPEVLRTVEKQVADKLVEAKFRRQDKSDYFKAPADTIWDFIATTLTQNKVRYRTIRI